MTTPSELIDGQVYRWKWRDKKLDADCAPYRSYHCKSQIAVVNRGRLIDTFWGDMSSERAIDPAEVELTLWCDESWPKIRDYEIPYYDRADIADTRHSNGGREPIYLRPGASKSPAAIMAEIEARECKARDEIRWAERCLERLAAARALLSEGKIDEVSL